MLGSDNPIPESLKIFLFAVPYFPFRTILLQLGLIMISRFSIFLEL